MTEMKKDFTAHTGPLEDSREFDIFPTPWRMFSYSRPAAHFWNGVANYFHDQGMTDDEIGEKLGSKEMRWMLDHGPIFDLSLDDLGYAAAQASYARTSEKLSTARQPRLT
jgi:hypothetical protein